MQKTMKQKIQQKIHGGEVSTAATGKQKPTQSPAGAASSKMQGAKQKMKGKKGY